MATLAECDGSLLYEGPKGRRLIATPVRAWEVGQERDRAPKVRESQTVAEGFATERTLSHLRRSVVIDRTAHALTGMAIY